MPSASAEECTMPDPRTATGGFGAGTGNTRRFVSSNAELQTRAGLTFVAVALREADPHAPEEERLGLLFVLRSCAPPGSIGVRIYGVSLSDTPAQGGESEGCHVAAYLTTGNAWRCVDAIRATGGRIMLAAITRRAARGGFDLVFPAARLHGTFDAELRPKERSRRR
jgi:hypothetical protein